MVLSIVVPIYNADKYLRQCLDSIITQSYKDYELILVDDGSEDESVNICNEYCSKYNNIKLINGMHMGAFYARKAGIEEAKGEYITFIDSDDFIDKDAYVIAEYEMDKDIDVVAFDIYRYHSEDEIKYDKCIFDEHVYYKEQIKTIIFPLMIWNETNNQFGIDPSLCNKVCKTTLIKQVYENTENIDFQYGEDTLVAYQVLEKANSISIHHYAYYYHRQRTNGEIAGYISDAKFLDKLYNLYNILSDKMKHIPIFQRQIDLFYVDSVGLVKRQYGIIDPPRDEMFPFDKVPQHKRIVIYGGGAVGNLYVHQLKQLNYCTIALWVDKNYYKLGNELSSPELIPQTIYDYVVVAVSSRKIRKQIYQYLLEIGVPDEKIVRRENDDY